MQCQEWHSRGSIVWMIIAISFLSALTGSFLNLTLMVQYYAKRFITLWDKLGWSSIYVGLDVLSDEGVIIYLNSNTIYDLDAIMEVQWTKRRSVRMRLLHQANVIQHKFLFDSHEDLYNFLIDLKIEPKQIGGTVCRGSFSNPIMQSPELRLSRLSGAFFKTIFH
jgi:hypothetical protein